MRNAFRLVFAAVAACVMVQAAPGSDLLLLPAQTTLQGPSAQQRLILVEHKSGRIKREVTEAVAFQSADPAVATVDESGKVQVVGDGETVITAKVGDETAQARIKVVGSRSQQVPSFRNQVIPILTRLGCNSGACHGALAGKGGLKLSLRGYDPDADHFAITRQSLGRRVDLSDPQQSLLLLKPTQVLPHGGGHRLDSGTYEYELLRSWLAAIAPGPKPDDKSVVRLETFPSVAELAPGLRMQVLVRAHYSDGAMADVTGWAKFSSTDDLVAGVDDSGLMKVNGHGEAAINVWFANQVAVVRVLSPHPLTERTEQLFASAERHNFIDDLVLAKLRTLNLPPSPRCGDGEFIRRAFLDTAGILPTVQEQRQFIADPAQDKRARLIDRLLKRQEFVDYWTYKWADLLLVSTRKLPQPAVWAFHQFIRQSVADNKPWNDFASEIVTASGSSLDQGAVNYFVLHKDTSELAEATSVTFMGMSITCCRCHNHPLERWTQDQYWSFANLFSRVALKNGFRPGEVLVHSKPDGEALHLRRGVAMPPTPLDAQPLPLNSQNDRREYFARWLTDPQNPYFAKAIVNRIWRNFMGRGLIEAEDDLRQTNPPSNEELLNALVADFVAPGDGARPYDLQRLMRQILNSATYQRSSVPLPENAADDRYGSRYLIRRLSAEVVLDAYSQVTGVPTPFNQLLVGTTGGTAGTNLYPLGTRASQLPDTQVVSTFLDAFGRPSREQTCACERQQDSSVGQALHLNNGQTLNDKLRDKTSLVEKWATEGVDDGDAIQRVFELALCRSPSDAELDRLKQLMKTTAEEPRSSRREVLEDLLWAVLTSREFLFNH